MEKQKRIDAGSSPAGLSESSYSSLTNKEVLIMARPMKESLNYFPLDANFFSDRKIRRLLKVFGGKGVTVYIFILCEVYRSNGYFLQYDDFYVSDISDALGAGFGTNLVSDVINFCLNTELFDRNIFDSHGVITSAGIQRRYLTAKETSAKRSYEILDLFLPEFCCLQEAFQDLNETKELCGEERGRTGKNGEERERTGKSGVIPPKVKERKVKESKVKESKEKEKGVFNAEAFGIKKPIGLELDFPECLETPSFKSAWADWLEYKKQRKQPYKPAGAKALLKQLAKFGPDEAIRKIEIAMANNWAGCVFSDKKSKQTSGRDTSSVISSLAERLKRSEAAG
jgi:hypothetical protein